MTKDVIFKGILPFIPVVIGAFLKFSLIDTISGDVSKHLTELYLRPLWIEFLVVAYVTGMTIILSRTTKKSSDILIFLGFPAVCFVFCLIFVLGFPKLNLISDFWQIHLPALFASLSLGIT